MLSQGETVRGARVLEEVIDSKYLNYYDQTSFSKQFVAVHAAVVVAAADGFYGGGGDLNNGRWEYGPR